MSPSAPRRPGSPPIAAIVGPTGSGKTDLALAIARRLPVEIVVADSRQVYRGMDIGTAKPDAAARAEVPHHLLDLVEPDQPFTVADWLARARTAAGEIASRGRLPLVVGGTGLYVSALIDGYDLAGAGSTPLVRARLAAELETHGLSALADRLARSDPQAAARIDLRNPRRVLRALERSLASGGGPAATPSTTPWPGRIAVLGISRPRDVLAARIDERVMAMFRAGLVDEVEALWAAGHHPDLSPMTGHGYREAARVAAGEWSIARAAEITARHTRQYAKRQLTWFRRDPRIVWLQAGAGPAYDPALVGRAAELLRALLS